MGRRSRRKLGSRCYKNYSQEMLEIAVDLVKRKEISSLEAEKRFYIPRRTIENKVKGLHSKPPGGQLRLSDREENDIVDVLVAAADFGSPLSRLDLRILIFEYLNKNKRACLFDNKLPGKWWVKHFLDRHHDKLTERTVQNIKKVRAEKTTEEFENYFESLKFTLKDVPSTNILNYDETNLSDNPGSTKCIFKRKVKYPERILNHSKGNISIMFAASADGCLLPVYTVYKSEHLWSTWCSNGPPEARYNRTKSGWFDGRVFEDWFESTIIPWAKKLQGPKVVIGDNLSSHLNINIVRLCEQNNIRFVFLPPNSSHIAQPLDVAYFGPLKKCWRKVLLDYKIKNPSEAQINKSHFPILLKQLLENIEVSSKDNIKAGFKATGIVPFNPNKLTRKFPDFEAETKYKIDSVLLDYLKKSKAPNPLKKTVIKKLNVDPGASISSEDVEAAIAKKETSKKKKTSKDTSKKTSKDTSKKTSKDTSKKTSNDTSKKTDLYTNPVASTSGTCTRKVPNRNLHKPKSLKVNSDTDDDEDNYSLRDSSDEDTIVSDFEDKILEAFYENNKRKIENENSSKSHKSEINTNQRKRTKEIKEEKNKTEAIKSPKRSKKRKVDYICPEEEGSDSSEDVYLSVYKKDNLDRNMEIKACDTNNDKMCHEDLDSFKRNQNGVTELNEDIDINNIENFIEIDKNGQIMEYDKYIWPENNNIEDGKVLENSDLVQTDQDKTVGKSKENNTQTVENESAREKAPIKKVSTERKVNQTEVRTSPVSEKQTKMTKAAVKQKITILSEIRNTFQKKIFVDVKKLKSVDKNVDLFKIESTNKYKENNVTESQINNLKLDSLEPNQNQIGQLEEVQKMDSLETNQSKTEGDEVEKLDLFEAKRKKTEESEVEKPDSSKTKREKTEESEVEKLDLSETKRDKTEESEVEKPDLSETKRDKTEESEVEKPNLSETKRDKTEESEVEKSDLSETKRDKTEESEVEKPDLSETKRDKTEESEVEKSDLSETKRDKTEESEVEKSNLSETKRDKTEERKIEKPNLPETQLNKTEEEENDYDINSIVVNQSVLVRYYIRAKWKYYIGFVEKIDDRDQKTCYTVSFLKAVKKPNLKFVVTKNDRDTVPAASIVKIVQLHSIKKNKEYCLVDSFDEVYF